MAKKLNIRLICAVVAASMAITPAAEAGGRGVALGILRIRWRACL